MIELGEELVSALGADRTYDIAARWMSHYVARLMEEAREAPRRKKRAAEAAAARAILALWKHRSAMPMDLRPFGDWEAVLHTLKELNPKSAHSRYFSQTARRDSDNSEASPLERILPLIEGIDYTARILSVFLLASATKEMVPKTKRWLKLSEGLERDVAFERVAMDHLCKLDEQSDKRLRVEHLRDMDDRLSRLQGFTKLAAEIERLLREERDAAVKAIESFPQGSETTQSNA